MQSPKAIQVSSSICTKMKSEESYCFFFFKAWADAFRSSPDLTGVVSVYEDLRRKGLEFPMTELNGYPTSHPAQKV